jgi:hypothetical protein
MFRISIEIILIVSQTMVLASPQLPYHGVGRLIVDGMNSGVNIGTAVAKQIGDIIPTPSEIFDFGKQTLLGLPLEVVVGAIKQICELAYLVSDACSDVHISRFVGVDLKCDRISISATV